LHFSLWYSWRDQVFYPPHDDPETLMLPQLRHDEHGRIVRQEIHWVEQADGSFKPVVPDRSSAG